MSGSSGGGRGSKFQLRDIVSITCEKLGRMTSRSISWSPRIGGRVRPTNWEPRMVPEWAQRERAEHAYNEACCKKEKVEIIRRFRFICRVQVSWNERPEGG